MLKESLKKVKDLKESIILNAIVFENVDKDAVCFFDIDNPSQVDDFTFGGQDCSSFDESYLCYLALNQSADRTYLLVFTTNNESKDITNIRSDIKKIYGDYFEKTGSPMAYVIYKEV